jgi:hypothetical protein
MVQMDASSVKTLYTESSNLLYKIAYLTTQEDYDFKHSIAVKALFDTGASDNWIHESVYQWLKEHGTVEETEVPKTIYYARKDLSSRQPVPTRSAKVMLRMELKEVPITIKLDVLVMKDLTEECIIGFPTLKKSGILTYIADPLQWSRTYLKASHEEEQESDFPDLRINRSIGNDSRYRR